MSTASDPHSPKPKPIPLKDLQSEKAGVLHPQDSVHTAGDRMRKHDAAAWPVAEKKKLVGMIDERNPDWKIGGHGHDPNDWQVGQIMNREVVFCYEDEDCVHAESLMAQHNLLHLPVVDREMRIVGIFSRREIHELASGDSERQRIARRAMEIARLDGRVAFTDDDFARASIELSEPEGSGKHSSE
jgi:CBS domain-containing protein